MTDPSTSDSFRSANLRALAQLQPELAARLSRMSQSNEIQIIPTQSGDVSGKIGETTLHSRHSPRAEADRLASQIEDAPCYVVEGFGMGYLAEALIMRSGDARVVVVEPDIPLFLQVANLRDLSLVFSSPKTNYLMGSDGAEGIAAILAHIDATDVRIVRFRPLYERHRGYFAAVDRAIEMHITRTQVNQNTLIRFGRLWVRNLTRNLPVFQRAKPLSLLVNKYRGLPGLLIGAGPSFDHVLPRLKALARKCIIVAVDTSLATCLSAGVEPDFVVVVDPQYWNTRHLDGAVGVKVPLISESSTHPRVFRLLHGDVFFCSSLFPLGTYIENHLGEMGALGAGGSVSTSGWDFLRILGCSPIYLTGVDLGFPNNQTHYRGSFFEERILSIGHRLCPGEDHSFHYLNDTGLFKVPDNAGSTVSTDKRMVIYRSWFEGQVRRYQDADTRSLSPNAVKLEGIRLSSIDEILEKQDLPMRAQEDVSASDVRSSGAKAASADEPIHERTGLPLAGTIRALLKELQAIESIAKEGLEQVSAAHDQLKEGASITRELSALNEIDGRIARNRHRNIVGFLMQEHVRSLSSRHRAITAENVLENSKAIYNGLLESCRFHRECLDIGLSRLTRGEPSILANNPNNFDEGA